MPNFDGSGPMGEGPKTGRGAGDCDSNKSAQYSSRPRLGRQGFGRGFFSRFCPFARRRITKSDLQEYKQELEEEIKEVEQDIDNIKD